jgi:hypothetical protein
MSEVIRVPRVLLEERNVVKFPTTYTPLQPERVIVTPWKFELMRAINNYIDQEIEAREERQKKKERLG